MIAQRSVTPYPSPVVAARNVWLLRTTAYTELLVAGIPKITWIAAREYVEQIVTADEYVEQIVTVEDSI